MYLGMTSRRESPSRRLPHDAVRYGSLALTRGDIVIVATDGIDPGACGMSAAEVVGTLRAGATLREGMEHLLERAGSRFSGGGDNLSLVVLEARQVALRSSPRCPVAEAAAHSAAHASEAHPRNAACSQRQAPRSERHSCSST